VSFIFCFYALFKVFLQLPLVIFVTLSYHIFNFPVEDCQLLASVVLLCFLTVRFIFLFVFLFRVLPEFSCRFFLVVLPTTLPEILSNKYESYFFFFLTV